MTPEEYMRNRERIQMPPIPGSEPPPTKTNPAMNALRHGLTARTVVLQCESQTEFDLFHAELTAENAPQSTIEKELIREIAEHSWRLRRASRYEVQLLDGADDDFAAVSKQLDNLRRYRTAAERAFHKAIDQLRKIQKDRLAMIKLIADRKDRDKIIRDKAQKQMLDALLQEQRGSVSQSTENDCEDDSDEQ